MRAFSVSSLNAYLTCPRKYYFSYVERLPLDREETARRFGLSNILHAALADFHAASSSAENARDWTRLDAALSSHWDPALFADARESADAYHRARWMLWDSFATIAAGNPIRYEYSFEHPYAGARLRGRIDRIDEENGALVVIDYVLGAHKPVHRDWGLRIYASILAKMFQKPIASIRVIPLGESGGAIEIAPDDPARVEGDVARLRAAIEADRTCSPKPDRHCAFCSYATICDAAWRDEARAPAGRRPNELFRLFCAVELLMNAGDSAEAFRRCAEASVRQLHSGATAIWIDGRPMSEELRRVFEAGAETEGEIEDQGGALRLGAGRSIIVPIAAHGVAVFPAEVSRTAAEILGRGLRIALGRALNFQAAAVDGLTGLFRRELCTRALEGLHGRKRSVVIVDIDRFKNINDTYGHDAGDAAIRQVARILREQSGGAAYRLGGEEFVLLVPDDDVAYALALAESVRRRIESTPLEFFGKSISVTASIGVAASGGAEDPEETLRRADGALYRAKESGRNRVERDG